MSNTRHVMPTADLIQHEATEHCVCAPTAERVDTPTGDGWIYIHHSLDGRERQPAQTPRHHAWFGPLRILATAITAGIGGALAAPAMSNWRTATGIGLIFIAGTVGAWLANRPYRNDNEEGDRAED